jgi:nitrous oxidase accessory protein
VPAEPGALAAAIAGASPGDVLILAPGRHDGPVVLEFPLTLDGRGAATIDGNGQGRDPRHRPDVTVRGLTIIGSGNDHPVVDSGRQARPHRRARHWSRQTMIENLVGVHVFGARTAWCAATPSGPPGPPHERPRQRHLCLERARHVVEGNDIRFGRDGIFANASRDNVFRDNLCAICALPCISCTPRIQRSFGNVSHRQPRWALRSCSPTGVVVTDNLSLSDRDPRPDAELRQPGRGARQSGARRHA